MVLKVERTVCQIHRHHKTMKSSTYETKLDAADTTRYAEVNRHGIVLCVGVVECLEIPLDLYFLERRNSADTSTIV